MVRFPTVHAYKPLLVSHSLSRDCVHRAALEELAQSVGMSVEEVVEGADSITHLEVFLQEYPKVRVLRHLAALAPALAPHPACCLTDASSKSCRHVRQAAALQQKGAKHGELHSDDTVAYSTSRTSTARTTRTSGCAQALRHTAGSMQRATQLMQRASTNQLALTTPCPGPPAADAVPGLLPSPHLSSLHTAGEVPPPSGCMPAALPAS